MQVIQAEIPKIKWSLSFTTRKKGKWKKMVLITSLFRNQLLKNLIDNSFFAEWEKVHGFYYGTSKDSIDNIIKKNEMLLLEMDVKGALSIKKLYPNKTFSIFITPPSVDHLRKRLQKRGTDSKYRINIRLQRFKEEMKYVSKFDFKLLNDDLAKAKDQLLDIILKIKKGDSNGFKNNTIS